LYVKDLVIFQDSSFPLLIRSEFDLMRWFWGLGFWGFGFGVFGFWVLGFWDLVLGLGSKIQISKTQNRTLPF